MTAKHAAALSLVLAMAAGPAFAQSQSLERPAMNPRSSIVEVGGRETAFFKVGSGPAVVIVHGIGGHKEDWSAVADRLSADHTVYAIDMLGFGGSSKTGEITVPDQAEAILGLLDKEGVAATDLVGNSVGGWVAATFAARHPDRVRRLVLVDPAGFKAMFEGPSPVNFYPDTAEDMANTLKHVRHDPATHTPQAAEAALAALRASGDAAAGQAVFAGLFASERLEDVADRITAPTLVVWGADDALFPAAVGNLVTGHIRGSRLVLIPDAGHFPQLDNPEGFIAPVKAFLAP